MAVYLVHKHVVYHVHNHVVACHVLLGDKYPLHACLAVTYCLDPLTATLAPNSVDWGNCSTEAGSVCSTPCHASAVGQGYNATCVRSATGAFWSITGNCTSKYWCIVKTPALHAFSSFKHGTNRLRHLHLCQYTLRLASYS